MAAGRRGPAVRREGILQMIFKERLSRRQVMTGAAGIGAAAALGGSLVYAQSATPSATPSTATSGATAASGAGARLYTDFVSKLASNLGNLDTAKVDTAVRDALKQMVDEAQQSGLIGANEAATLKSQIDSSNFPGDLVGDLRGRFGGRGGMMGGMRERGGRNGRLTPKERLGLDVLGGLDVAGLAQFMGISRAELVKDLANGQSLAEIAQAHGKSRADLKAYLVSQATGEIDKLIDAKRGGKKKQQTTPGAATPAATPSTT